MNIHKLIDKKMKEYVARLFKAKTALKILKKETNPQLRIVKGMETLPELKERVLNCRQVLDDLAEIRECLEKESKK